ncbi:molybdopterin-binding protein [Cocleimonas sp. KMM 6892]|uniref:competence/damage-inducible protein A n=1 Tax=unclassified Cocleimonas TaxID=2639732 RepID=UPI002DBD93FB|nr:MULTISPECIES: molybdopterin-binding protein [unclassified Cocleimonas]MEB8431628.1 molybdopterin-binding protein [Cocleimonas sp. KMM 6892]MEC4713600.1 molybdopterin-binding protein [Cocleimonas sp. KMM 6895]MEC4742931.1 molybdopterin-binding protein [Cocleimonas sp. KMM 6896]
MSNAVSTDQKIGLILIGDELLNGSRQDKHMAHVIEILKARGMSLSWVRMIGDTREEIVANLNQTKALNDVVFSFGGIGATPDDQTRAAASEAFNQKFIRHPEAKALIEDKFGESAYPSRILMADLPEHATMIPNPVNQVPGFKIEHHHFVPGFPDMAWPMVEWVLDTYYAHLKNDTPNVEWRWDILGTPESVLLPMMNELLKEFEAVNLSSLPSTVRRGDLIDFGLKGPEEDVTKAAKWLEEKLQAMDVAYKFREAK